MKELDDSSRDSIRAAAPYPSSQSKTQSNPSVTSVVPHHEGGEILSWPPNDPASWHRAFEVLAYLSGGALYRRNLRLYGSPLAGPKRWLLPAGAILGAALGAKILHHLVDPMLVAQHWQEPEFWLIGGRTIVGGLLGGWLGVEVVKRRLGVGASTGDAWFLPLLVGIIVGRVGCFLGGLSDGTFGIATALPWGVDFGDGVPRHPTQLYEIALLLLAYVFVRTTSTGWTESGARFRLFVFLYLVIRLLVDFLKPYPFWFGLQSIQWACVFALLLCWRDVGRLTHGIFTGVALTERVRGA